MDQSVIERMEQRPQDDPRLGRQLVHDRRSRGFLAPRSGSREYVRHRIYDPYPNPEQVIGNCTGCSECQQMNAVGNRVSGVVLKMPKADKIYARATELDPFEGTYPPTDTGSSGLAAVKASVEFGLARGYDWCFGLEHVLDTLQIRPVSVGAWWHRDMFNRDPTTLMVTATGGYAGGHQWTLVAHSPSKGWVEGLTWWGDYKRFRMTEDTLGALLDDDGDAHVTYRKI